MKGVGGVMERKFIKYFTIFSVFISVFSSFQFVEIKRCCSEELSGNVWGDEWMESRGMDRSTRNLQIGGNRIRINAVTRLELIGQDKKGDNVVNSGSIIDIVKVDAAADSSEVTIKVFFSDTSTIDFVNDFFGFMLIDIDQDPSTGKPADNLFGTPNQILGFEFSAILPFVDILDERTGAFMGSVNASFDARTIEFTIPLKLLDNDDGFMDVVFILGDNFGPTDWAPDSGNYTIKSTAVTPAAELCFDGIDNDFDGQIDCDDSDCASDSACFPTSVIVAEFDANPRTGTEPLSVQFTDQSSSTGGSIATWKWDFGDGNVDDIQNPINTYQRAGFYTVTLTIRDSIGGFESNTKNDFITVNSAGQVVADFSESTTKGTEPLGVQFTDLSFSPNGPIISWFWDFGDGELDFVQNPFHTYNFAGFFTVFLEVGDTFDKFGSKKKPNLIFVEKPGQPAADFSASPTTGLPPLSVQFTDLSSSPNGAIDFWFWDFGDGGVGFLQHPRHRYTSAGFFSVALEVEDVIGTLAFINKPNFIVVTQSKPPVAAFDAFPTNGFAPLDVQFSDLSTSPNGSIVNWDWSFGDGEFDVEQNPFHTYQFAGIYSVNLKVEDELRETDSLFKDAIIVVDEEGVPEADFSATPQSGSAPLTVQFTDLSTSPNGSVVKWNWDFDDGDLANEQNPIHEFGAGFFSIELSVTDETGEIDSITKSDFIVVSLPNIPVANFSANPNFGPAPLTVKFTDNSSSPNGSITGWSWSFGDGSGGGEQNPSHKYNFQGFYTVELEVFDETGQSAFITKPNLIEVMEGDAPLEGEKILTIIIRTPFDPSFLQHPNRILVPFGENSPDFPVVLGVIDRNSGDFLENVAVDAIISDTSIAVINPVSTVTSKPASGSIPLAEFKIKPLAGGVARLQITAEDPDDSSNSVLRILSVEVFCLDSFGRAVICPEGGGPVPIATPDDGVPNVVVAEFSGDPLSGFAPLDVQFFSQSTGNISNWAWDFGDGGVSSEQNPEHTFNVEGIFTVGLTVSGPDASDTETKTNYIVALGTGGVVAEFSASPTTGFSPLSVQFSDLSAGDISSWAWSFGNGAISSEQSPVATYKTSGIFTVGLTISGTDASDTETKTNLINILEEGAPQASFSATPTAGKVPLLIQFSDVSEGDITSWTWDFGDGGLSTEQNPTHTYLSEGFFTVALTVSGSKGAAKETKTNLIIAEGIGAPIAEFSATPTVGQIPLNVVFSDLSQPEGLIDSWTWAFGDGASSTEQNPSHTFNSEGFFTVSLTVSNVGGADSEIKTNFIQAESPPVPVAEFSATPTAGEVPLDVQFTDLSEPVGKITSWLWDIGDGSSSTDQNPTHTYSNAGIFSISLIVSNSTGADTETKTNLVNVALPPAPVANFAAAPTIGVAPLTVTFQDLSEPRNKIDSWLWDFGDGGSSTEQNPTHIYSSRGRFTVTLTISNSNGASVETQRNLIRVKIAR